MPGPQLVRARDSQIKVELLGDLIVWPGCLREQGNLLERQARRAGRVMKHKPVVALLVTYTGARRFVAGPVVITEKLAVELCQAPRISCIEHDLAKAWKRRIAMHERVILGTPLAQTGPAEGLFGGRFPFFGGPTRPATKTHVALRDIVAAN